MYSDDKLFCFYQDWVHQNNRTHLDFGIEEDDKWQQIWKKIIRFPAQRYDVLSGRVRKRFVDHLAVETDIIWNQHWNAEKVIIFQTVILHPIYLVPIARKIRERITSHLNLWNKCAYNELAQDSYGLAWTFLGNKRNSQTQDQCHSTFSNLIMRGKLR